MNRSEKKRFRAILGELTAEKTDLASRLEDDLPDDETSRLIGDLSIARITKYLVAECKHAPNEARSIATQLTAALRENRNEEG